MRYGLNALIMALCSLVSIGAVAVASGSWIMYGLGFAYLVMVIFSSIAVALMGTWFWVISDYPVAFLWIAIAIVTVVSCMLGHPWIGLVVFMFTGTSANYLQWTRVALRF